MRPEIPRAPAGWSRPRGVPALAGAVALAVLALVAGCASVPRPAGCTDDDFTEVDKAIAIDLFQPSIWTYPNGHREEFILGTFPSPLGIDPENRPRDWACSMRATAAFEEHYRLIEVHHGYRVRWERAAAQLLERLGGDTRISYREGAKILYPVFLRACIYHDIFAALGPPEVTDHPWYDGKDDPKIWGSATSPFFSFDYIDGPSWPPSVLPFHYCAGTGGLTVSGGEDDPWVRAMVWLKRHDRRFRRDWEDVLRRVAPLAEQVDPLDVEAGRRVTAAWRQLLLEGGRNSLAARIEARAEAERRRGRGNVRREDR